MKKSLIIAGAVIGALVIGGVALAEEGSFMDAVAKWTGFYNSEKLQAQGQLSQQVSGGGDRVIGAGAHSYSVKQLGSSSVTSNAVTTTCFTNNGSSAVVLDKLFFSASTTAPFITATPTFAFAISTDTVNVQTGLGFWPNPTVASGWSTTTLTYISTSTFSTPLQRVLPVGSSVIAYSSNGSMTSTIAVCGAEYYQP